jgi:hypothetical protein
MSLERAVLFAWAAALPLHSLARPPFLPRATLGDLLFPIAFAIVFLRGASVSSVLRERALFAPFAVVAVGFLPSVLAAAHAGVAASQLAILLYVTLLFAAAAKGARDGHGDALRAGFVTGVTANALLGLFGVVALVITRAPNGFTEITGAGGRITSGADLTLIRVYGATEGANMLAAQIAVALFLLVSKPTRSTPEKVALAVLVTALPFTAGHVMLAGTAALCVHSARTSAGVRRTSFSAGAAAALASLVLFTVARGLPLSAAAPFVDLRPSPYLLCHVTALSIARAHPFFGVGLEHFADAWPSHVDRALEARAFEGMDLYIGTAWDPHSTYLGFAAEGGVAGVLAMAALVVLLFRARHRAPPAFFGLAVFALVAAFVLDVLTNREIAFGLGLLLVPFFRTNGSNDRMPLAVG